MVLFVFSSRRRQTRCALVTGVQTCALPISESGGTARFLSRFRSSVPIYALSRHDGSRRRMALMRDVFPIDFDSRGLATREAARDAVQALHDAGLLAAGDHIMFTSRSEEHTSESSH